MKNLFPKNLPIFLLVDPYCDHCNRLFQSVHFHAYCLEHHHWFFNFGIMGMLRQCPRSLSVLRDAFLLPFKVLARIPLLGCLVCKEPPDSALTPLIFVGGWGFRCHDLTRKYHSYLSSFYRLRHHLSPIEQSLLQQIRNQRQNGTKVVGLHVRRGDYATWQGGKYWISDASYVDVVRAIRAQFLDLGQECYVVVFTNDILPPCCAQDRTASGRWFADLMAMQNCDLLVGPPSTFTLWASFSGSVPYIHLNGAQGIVNLDSASICLG